LFLARLPRISANWNEKYRPCSFQTLANISGKFPEILNFWKIYNLTRDLPCLRVKSHDDPISDCRRDSAESFFYRYRLFIGYACFLSQLLAVCYFAGVIDDDNDDDDDDDDDDACV